MKNKIIFLSIAIVVVFMSLIFIKIEYYSPETKVEESSPIIHEVENSISIMIEDENGNYVRSSSNTWPSSTQYSLNYSKSYCRNGSTFTYANNKVTVDLQKADVCYMYFDLGSPMNFYVGGSSNPGYAKSTSSTIYASWEDSSITSYCISNTNSCNNYTNLTSAQLSNKTLTKSHTLSSGDGTKTVYLFYKTSSGVVNYIMDDIILDTQAPKCCLTVSTSGVSFDTITDNLSSYEEIDKGMSTSSTATYNGTTTLTLSKTTFYGFVRDQAGNTSSCTAAVSSPTLQNSGYSAEQKTCQSTSTPSSYNCSASSTGCSQYSQSTQTPTCSNGATPSNGTCSTSYNATATEKCPSGWSTSANSKGDCYQNNGSTPYCSSYNNCPSGYSFNSTYGTCISSQSQTPTCPSGYTKSGSSCVKTYDGSCTSNCVTNGRVNLANWSCPQGGTKNCSRTACTCIITTYPNVCPSGYVQIAGAGTNCVMVQNRTCKTYSCSSGYPNSNNTKCYSYTDFDVTYSCPNGGTLSGTKCNSSTTASCPSGYSLSGNTCYGTGGCSTYTFPDGYTSSSSSMTLYNQSSCPSSSWSQTVASYVHQWSYNTTTLSSCSVSSSIPSSCTSSYANKTYTTSCTALESGYYCSSGTKLNDSYCYNLTCS